MPETGAMRRLLDTVTRLISWTRRRQLYRPAEPVKLNLGSGLTVAPGWVNIDSSLNALAARFPKTLMFLTYKFSSAQRWYSFSDYVELLQRHEFIHHDLAYGIPLPDHTAECIYASHFVEHLDRAVAESLFREVHRVLIPGGTLRLVVPDVSKLVASYQAGNTEAIIEALFGKPGEGWYSRHRYLYDFPLLKRLLEERGFAGVESCEDGVGLIPDLNFFEGTRPDRYLLFVEAQAVVKQTKEYVEFMPVTTGVAPAGSDPETPDSV
jgi:SAM-dependent methyltransferase